jgi:hypothetical protein
MDLVKGAFSFSRSFLLVHVTEDNVKERKKCELCGPSASFPVPSLRLSPQKLRAHVQGLETACGRMFGCASTG